MVLERLAASIAIVVEQLFARQDIVASDQQQMRSVLDFNHFREQVSSSTTVIHEATQTVRFRCGVHAVRKILLISH